MLLDHDDLQDDLATALRGRLTPAMSAADVHECLTELELYALEAPAAEGGLELGLCAGVIVCEELGRVAAPDRYRSVAAEPDSRVRQAAYLLGCAEGAHALAAARAARRTQFGQPIGSFQAVVFPLAAQVAEIEAARLLVHRAAWLVDQGAEATLAAVEALATATELAFAVVRHAMHVHGAFGMTHAAAIHRYHLTVAVEGTRWGTATRLWQEAAALRTRVLVDTGRAT